ncbi:MAG: tRNA adenosine(34) deaminase TadA [Candidatus Izemoplasmatales bacterium]|nr:tRNA adenosine(34) deaminase TadA [bacterium]MDZ4195711.1 tRNA adenosine(34) deaminase TadA [Candidatus Izemoplasmatales bacterium]
MTNDEHFMQEALKEAQIAYSKGEVPVGAVITWKDEIIARGHNQRETLQHVFAHAEMLAIDEAVKVIGSWRLDECTLYVTLEPCAMCAGAMIQSRVKKLIYGAKEPKSGVHGSIVNLFDQPFNHSIEIISGVLAEESSQLLKTFFKSLRNTK